MFKLVIQDDEGKTTVVPLIRDEITIGRKEGNTIRLTERNVSRRHARILRNNGEVHIEDLGSYNGIRVNNARIAERVSLRVSDQVQIGDYKLYLKAEGHEQTDEGHTSQHGRLEAQIATTEAMNAVTPAATAPQAVQNGGAQLVGSPGHTLVSIGDSAVRAAAVPAVVPSATGSYGRLVVVSSNFAGKEFELTQPQMIVGRTDDNDIVVNHRSISRNHAKLVRDPDNGRYTISDLQSSNGVRVNGQDYGKVELRRGDVVDLGHVRLRFVDIGEDFVFARDAVITDVPEAGSRRGLLFAVLAAIVVLGAGVAIYITLHNNNNGSDQSVATPGSQGTNEALADAGDTVAAIERPTPVEPTVAVDAAAPAITPIPPSTDEKGQRIGSCLELQAAKKWQELRDCAATLDKLGAKDRAKEFTEVAVREQQNSLTADLVARQIRDRNLRDAQASLAKIGDDSIYAALLRENFGRAENQAIDAALRKAHEYANNHDCPSLRTLYKQLAQSSTARVAQAVAPVKCEPKVAAVQTPQPPLPPPTEPNGTGSAKQPPSVGANPGSGSSQPATTPAPTAGSCGGSSVEDLTSQAQSQYQASQPRTALTLMVKALGCKQEPRMYRIAALYACAARDFQTAKVYFKRIDPSQQSAIVQRCLQEGFDLHSQ